MRLKVGVVGSGWISENRHIPSYKRDGRTEVVAVADHKIERAEAMAKAIGVKNYFSTIDDMLKLEPDIVSICTPPWTHKELVVAALEAGCHVLTEKPMAMSLSEVDEMISACNRTKQKLCVVHNFLYSNSMMKAKGLLSSGKLGKIVSVMALQLSSQRRRLPEWYSKLPGGLFYDEVPHMIYLMQHFAGTLEPIFAEGHGTIASTRQVSRVSAVLQNTSLLATLNMIFESPVSDWLLTVVAEKAVLTIDVFRDIIIVRNEEASHKPSDVLNSSVSTVRQEVSGIVRSGARYATGNLLYGHDRLISEFIDSIEEDRAPPITPQNGRQIVEIMWGIIERAKLADL